MKLRKFPKVPDRFKNEKVVGVVQPFTCSNKYVVVVSQTFRRSKHRKQSPAAQFQTVSDGSDCIGVIRLDPKHHIVDTLQDAAHEATHAARRYMECVTETPAFIRLGEEKFKWEEETLAYAVQAFFIGSLSALNSQKGVEAWSIFGVKNNKQFCYV